MYGRTVVEKSAQSPRDFTTGKAILSDFLKPGNWQSMVYGVVEVSKDERSSMTSTGRSQAMMQGCSLART